MKTQRPFWRQIWVANAMLTRGLTLKELLVAVAIIVLLLILLFPIGRIVRYRLYEARCRANMAAIMGKYQELRSVYRDRFEARRELTKWLTFTPEGQQVAFCPLSPQYGFYSIRQGTVYEGISDVNMLVPCSDPEIVLVCYCHSATPRSVKTCIEGVSSEEKYLSLLEDGQIAYRPDLPNWVRLRDCPGARLGSPAIPRQQE